MLNHEMHGVSNFERKLVDEAATSVGEAVLPSETGSSVDNSRGTPGVGN